MKLLLDQHYSPEVAKQLQDAGYDVTAVSGDPDLEGMEDEPLLRHAAEQGRALSPTLSATSFRSPGSGQSKVKSTRA